MTKKIGLYFFLLVTWIVVASLKNGITQDGRELSLAEKVELIQSLNKRYSCPNQLLEFTLRTYAGHTTTIPADAETGSSIMYGDLKKSEFMGITTYRDESTSVTIDTKQKVIVVANLNSKDSEMQIEKLWLQYLTDKCRVTRIDRGNEIVFDIIYPGDEQLTRSRIIVNKTMYIKSCILYLAREIQIDPNDPRSKSEKPRFELDILKFVENPSIDVENLSYSDIVNISGKKASLTAKYQGYTLYDSRPIIK